MILYQLWDERGLVLTLPLELALTLAVSLLLFTIYHRGPTTPLLSIATTATVMGIALGVGYSLERRYAPSLRY